VLSPTHPIDLKFADSGTAAFAPGGSRQAGSHWRTGPERRYSISNALPKDALIAVMLAHHLVDQAEPREAPILVTWV
jgi:hypothetical protein